MRKTKQYLNLNDLYCLYTAAVLEFKQLYVSSNYKNNLCSNTKSSLHLLSFLLKNNKIPSALGKCVRKRDRAETL